MPATLDLDRIMNRLQRILSECEAEIAAEGWRIRLHVSATCYHEASYGVVSFSVGTPTDDDADDC